MHKKPRGTSDSDQKKRCRILYSNPLKQAVFHEG